ncbi:MAG TPA: tetratricopeptide repeat protein [Caulobacterales bacterium]|nr:tetratricopeptide repeat protein [Caulobacterales bacterium]
MASRATWGWAVLALGLTLALAACERKPADPLAEARAICNKDDGAARERVVACTKLLDEGGLAGAVRAAALAMRSQAHFAADERTAALRDAEAALNLDPGEMRAAYVRASILLDSGQLDAAELLVDRMIAARYRLDEAQLFAGRVALARSDYPAAVSAFNSALEQHPDWPDALALRGRAEELQGHGPSARTDYDNAIARDSTRTTQAYAWRCWMELRAKEDSPQVRADAEAAVRAQPRSVEAHTCLGVVQLKAGEWGDAKNSFDAALQIRPGDPTALFGRGVARRRSGDGKGSEDINQASDFDWRVREFFLSLGVQTY